MVGGHVLDRRQRDERADVHQRSRVSRTSANLGFLQLAFGYLIGRIALAYTLLPRYYNGQSRHGVCAARAALRPRDAAIHVDRVHGHARHGRLGARLRDRRADRADHRPAAAQSGGDAGRGARCSARSRSSTRFAAACAPSCGPRSCRRRCISSAACRRSSLAGHLTRGRLERDPRRASAAGKLQVINWSTGLRPAATRCAPVSSAARSSRWRRTAPISSSCSDCCRRARSRTSQVAVIGSGVAVIFQFALFLMLGIGLWGFYGAKPVREPRLDLPDVHRRSHAARAGRPAARRRARRDDEHALGRDQLARRGVDARHLSPAHRATGRRSATLRVGRIFALFWGIVLTGGALLFPENPKTPVVVIALSIASFTYGGLLGGFFLAIFWRRARQRDAILGMSVGIAAMSVIVFAKQISAAVPALAPALAPRVADRVALVRADRHDHHPSRWNSLLADARAPPPAARREANRIMTFIVIGIDGGGSKTHAMVADEQGRVHRRDGRSRQRRASRAGRAFGERDRGRRARRARVVRDDARDAARALRRRRRRGTRDRAPGALAGARGPRSRHGARDPLRLQHRARRRLWRRPGRAPDQRNGFGGVRPRPGRRHRALRRLGPGRRATKAAARGSAGARCPW